MESLELGNGKSKEQIYMEELYRRIGFDFELFDLPVTASKEEYDRKYQISCQEYLAGNLTREKWSRIDRAYSVLCDYYKRKEQEEREEADRKNRDAQWEAEKLRRQIDAKWDEELRKGSLWATLEALQKQESRMPIEKCWDSIKRKIFLHLGAQYVEQYQDFLQGFLELWDQLYQEICRDEYEEWEHKNLQTSRYRSIGMDELTLERYELGKYCTLFETSKLFSRMIPDSDDYYFLNAHFQLIANFREIEYKMEYPENCPIFSFLTTSRIQKAKQEFLARFDEEVRNGIRKNCLVDSQEMLEDIRRKLSSHNSLFQVSEKKQKKISSSNYVPNDTNF